MAKFAEANVRKMHNIFVCRVCKSKIRASNMKILQGKVKCRNCNSKALRVVRKK